MSNEKILREALELCAHQLEGNGWPFANKSAIAQARAALAALEQPHADTVRLHWLRDHATEGQIRMYACSGDKDRILDLMMSGKGTRKRDEKAPS